MSSDGTEVVILSAGAITSVGLSLMETAAATRARLAGLREIGLRDRRFERFVAAAVADDGLPQLAEALLQLALPSRQSRMLRMAHVALAEAMAPLTEVATPIPLLLGLPEHHTQREIEPRTFMKALQAQADTRFHKTSIAVPRGRAAGLQAVRQAMSRLAERSCDYVLVGGVDSLLDPYVLGTLDLHGRIRNTGNPDGFAPGEGAGFLLLSTAAKARELGIDPLAQIAGSAMGQEAGHIYSDEPYLGEGLAAAFAALFAEIPSAQPIASLYASFNGERYWGKEFGVARLRNAARFADALQVEHPAECFGDLGAAHGAVLAALAAHALSGAYRPSPSLVYASSDYGDRAALLLTTAL